MPSDDDASMLTDCSSPLSSVASCSLSPPPELTLLSYPSPPASQDSSDTDSSSADDTSSIMVASATDGPPPRKKRRTGDLKERATDHLDLRYPRVKESEQEQLDLLLKTLHKRRKIVVVAGAGMSVSAGIPDFRSSTGLFTSLRAEYNLKGSGKHLFDASVYKDDLSTSTFHDMVRSMSKLTRDAKPTPFHQMLATLAKDGRLLRLYTQNVDGLDTGMEPLATRVPLKKVDGKWPTTVQLHGGLDKMECTKCKTLSDFDADLFDGPEPPVCPECVEIDRLRTDVAGKRSHGIGRLRPRMVLYNEHNPDDVAIGDLVAEDLRKRPDAIIVVGTSLKIPGVKRIVREMCATVRDRRDGVSIWINNDPEPSGAEFKDCWDIVVRGKCDEVAKRAALRKWYETDVSTELTEEEWTEKTKTECEIVINDTWRPLSSKQGFRRSITPTVDFSPIVTRAKLTSNTNSVMADEDIGAPPTPSKSNRSSPCKPKPTASDAIKGKKLELGKKAMANSRRQPTKAKAKAKATATKTAKTASKPAAKAKAQKAQPKITLKLKQTKAFAAPAVAGKKASSPAKAGHKRSRSQSDDVMRPVESKDSRINSRSPSKASSPAKRPAHFPNLAKSLTHDKRMSIDRLVSS